MAAIAVIMIGMIFSKWFLALPLWRAALLVGLTFLFTLSAFLAACLIEWWGKRGERQFIRDMQAKRRITT
jgi:Na+-driven multidrug efflux pump